ncbi:MAG: hypothetical protein GWP19_01495 [Planctomycetia bacterium]|nr:hypothetical protein [Planctomycetia bacterium]
MAKPINPARESLSEDRKNKISESLKRFYKENPVVKLSIKGNPGVLQKYRETHDQNGSNNPNWKGGITDVLTLIRKSRKSHQWRIEVYERDNYTCQECGQNGGELNAHHIKSFSMLIQYLKTEMGEVFYKNALDFAPLWDVDNGVTLCVACHKRTDNYSIG